LEWIITDRKSKTSVKIREIRGLFFVACFLNQGRLKLQFEVNGQSYFLNFAEDEGRWYVFAQTLTGVNRIPVYVDAPKYERIGVLEAGRHKIQN
jgi:hypothetical protein